MPALSDAQLSSFEEWLRLVLWEGTLDPSEELTSPARAFSIHRTKGRLLMISGSVKMVQGVREVFEIVDLKDSSTRSQVEAPTFEGKLILIGRGLAGQPWDLSLRRYLEV